MSQSPTIHNLNNYCFSLAAMVSFYGLYDHWMGYFRSRWSSLVFASKSEHSPFLSYFQRLYYISIYYGKKIRRTKKINGKSRVVGKEKRIKNKKSNRAIKKESILIF